MSDEFDSIWERQLDRRGVIAAGAFAALVAAGGGRFASSAEAAAELEQQLGGTLHYYNWADYVNPKTYGLFTKATGVKVRKSFYVSNETLQAKLKAGARGYDLIAPTGYMVKVLAADKLLQPIQLSKLPNVRRNLDPRYRSLPFEPTNRYYVPKDLGTTGFIYRKDLVRERPTTWKQFFDLTKGKYSGKVTVLDSSHEVIGAGLKMFGYSYNTDSRSELNKVRDLLLDVKEHIHSIDSVTYRQKLISGKAVMGLGWNGDGAVVALKKPAEYVVPAEGTEFWVDCYCIPVGARNPDAAHAWINFVYQPRINALETSYTYYGSPLKQALLRKVLAKNILNNPDVFPPPALRRKLEPNKVSPAGGRLRERIWTEFKAK
jgi:spermidine/putrescine transport system substrate-binding protein